MILQLQLRLSFLLKTTRLQKPSHARPAQSVAQAMGPAITHQRERALRHYSSILYTGRRRKKRDIVI